MATKAHRTASMEDYLEELQLGFVFLEMKFLTAFEDCKYRNFCFDCKCCFVTKDGKLHEIDCDLENVGINEKPGFLESDHVFLLYAHGLYAVVQRDDGEHNLSIYSSCQEALKKCGDLNFKTLEETAHKSESDSKG
ncbi:hypothetical protein ACOSQ2_021737 [Xanthoceras sorbifolium]